MINKSYYSIVGSLVLIVALGGCFGARSASSGATINMDNLAGKPNIMPIAVIGSGPAGLMAAVYGARGGKPTYVIEGNKPGGLLMDTTEVANWPGEIMITGPRIIEKLRLQALHHGVTFIEDSVERIDTSVWPYAIHTDNGETLYAMTIIIATGSSPRKLKVPGEDEYWGAGVTSCAVCDAPFFKKLEVVVVGGGDSAVEEAIQLSSYASKVTILVRKDTMRAAASMQARLAEYPNVSIKYNVEIEKVVGDGTSVTGVQLFNHATKQSELFATHGVFLAVGHDPNTRFLKGIVPMAEGGNILVKGRTQATEVPGIFAAGDVEDHRYRQAGSSAGYGIDAGLDAVRFLDDVGFNPAQTQAVASQLYATGAQNIAATSEHGIQELATLEDFEKIIATKGVVIVDFWTQTCPSCKQMLPLFRSVSEEYAGKVTFATVDADEGTLIAEKLFVHKVPCLLVFRDGSLIARYTSTLSRKELSAFVEQFV